MSVGMLTTPRWGSVWLSLVLSTTVVTAHAGLFDDNEARKAILDLRTRQEQNQIELRKNNTDLNEQLSQLKSSLLELNNQLETLRADHAKLQGQNEQLARDLAEVQRVQKDLQQGAEDRARKLEPQKVTLDDKEFSVVPDEKSQYEAALAYVRKGEFDRAAPALLAFMKSYPASGYTESAQFWLGNAQYGLRAYREAMNTFRGFLSRTPQHARAAEAMLALANCQLELKDNRGARKTFDELIRVYPQSEAAAAAKERLAGLGKR
jgi:tol-pal system protein YbgF